MTETSARLGLPLLVPGQAQKEMFHNEALARLDLAVQASVLAVGFDSPPETPLEGQCWIVGAAPEGAWSGQAWTLAGWTAGGWRFVAPFAGMSVWDTTAGQIARYLGGRWVSGIVAGTALVLGGDQVVGARRPAIAAPIGGATVDAQARTTLAAILAALAAHGLIDG